MARIKVVLLICKFTEKQFTLVESFSPGVRSYTLGANLSILGSARLDILLYFLSYKFLYFLKTGKTEVSAWPWVYWEDEVD